MIPLSYAQRRLWFLNRLEGSSSAYHVPLVLRFDGVPDRAALAAALADVVARHEVLRTVFPAVDGEPYQRVLDHVADLLTVQTCPAGDVDALMAAFIREPFDLSVQAPVRARLYVADHDDAAARSTLVLLVHHVATDGRSTGPLLRDLSAAYAARSAGGAPDWEPLPVQYADFTLWQRDLLGEPKDPDSELSRHLAYWREALDGTPESLDLPADRLRPAEPSQHAAIVVVRLGAGAHGRLAELARSHRASLFMVLQAGLAMALCAVGAGRDIPLGTAVAGRGTEEALDELVGFFVNTLVLRADLSGDPTPAVLVERIREAALAAYLHEDLPFDVLVEQLNPTRALGVHPFFQVMLTLDEAAGEPLRFGPLTARLEPARLDAAKFDLNLFCTQLRDASGRPDGIEVWLQYATELFDEPTARLLAAVYISTLERIAADPQSPWEPAAVLTAEQREQLTARRTRLARLRAEAQAASAAHERGTDGHDSGRRAAGSPHREIISGLFAEILGRDAVDPADNFFRIGGHSLLATKLVNRIRAALGVELGIKDLFLAPTVAGLDERVQLLKAAASGRAPLVRMPRPDRVPLSYAQRRLWFIDQLEGGGHAYNLPVVLRLDRRLDPGTLARALRDVTDRHESLRTIFAAHEGEPFQTILEHAEPRLTIAETAADRLDAAITAATRYQFDLAAEIPLRAWLFEARAAAGEAGGRGEGEAGSADRPGQILVLLLHHIAADGWSTATLINDLNTAYTARLAGHAPQWAELPVQYADYALWQHSTLGDADDPDSAMAEALGFWRDALADSPPVLPLPADRPRRATPTHQGDLVPFTIGAHTHQRLSELARRSGATLFMVLQAGFAALLHRLGAGDDLPIGTAVSGREDQALDGLVGFFVNTLVLRTDASGNPGFDELVDRVRSADLAAYAHQHLPFDQLVEQLSPNRTTAYHPFIQVMLMLNNQAAPRDPRLALAGTELRVDSQTAKFDLTLALRELDGDAPGAAAGLAGVLEYAADLFDRSTAARIAALYARVLDAVADDPTARIDDVELFDEDESRTLRCGLAVASSTPYAELAQGSDALDGTTIPQLFDAHVRTRPDAVALITAARQLSYAGLDAAAREAAQRLAARGVRRGDTIGLVFDRSATAVVVALAALRCGAAYMFIDHEHGSVAADSTSGADPVTLCSMLFAEPGHADRIARRYPDIAVVEYRADDPSVSGLEVTTHSEPADAAFIVLSAGTAGARHAVAWSHRAVAQSAGGIGSAGASGATHLAWAPLSSPEFAAELWSALLTGATCALSPDRIARPELIGAQTAALGITDLTVAPATFNVLIDEHHADLASVRRITIVGERPCAEHLNRALLQLPGTEFFVAYRLAEYGALVTRRAMAEPVTGFGLTAGSPLGGTRCYVLDERLRFVSHGVPGDLYVAGPALAHGIDGSGRVSVACFIADPFGRPGSRMIRTGDRARWSVDGHLEVLGRAGEQAASGTPHTASAHAEAVLAGHASVRRVAVALAGEPGENGGSDGGDGSGGGKPTAYVVPQPGVEIDESVLLAYAAGELPEPEVPEAVLVVDALPLTAEGRLDRTALATLRRGHAPSAASTAASSDATGEALVETLLTLFAEVLGGRRVEPGDNFFRVGGHSLSAVRLLNRVRTELGADLGLRDIFQAPSAAGLARRILAAAGSTAPERPAAAAADAQANTNANTNTPESAEPQNRPALRRRTRGGAVVRETVSADS
ncbi:condensation domain-containing protein [Actinocrinis sp.]|uniref:condensation domain-containing protein n=1 Tax=Actinocrinis sp. TaxID=1920516 RepID=UPI002D383329|nr:condensation domain-containing protein [Actinocrinis sp.]HZP50428.1 condensation domain-containing protein [Actinocrinis sp.]